MPTISQFYGIDIYMYYNDNQKHHKPHVHVSYGDYKAVIDFKGEVLEGNLSTKQYNLVCAWIKLHIQELVNA